MARKNSNNPTNRNQGLKKSYASRDGQKINKKNTTVSKQLKFLKGLIIAAIITIIILLTWVLILLFQDRQERESLDQINNSTNMDLSKVSSVELKESELSQSSPDISSSSIDTPSEEDSSTETSAIESSSTKTSSTSVTSSVETNPSTTTTNSSTEIVSPDGRRGTELDTPFTINGIEVINKNHWVSQNYRPLPDSYQNNGLREPAWSQFLAMQAAAATEGVNIVHISSYRTFELQNYLFNKYSYNYGVEAASRFSSRPGQSEHQSGLAIDITSGGPLVEEFANTPGGIWLWENAYKFGFILRYPGGKENITGYMFEPWHYRYIGIKDAANFGPNSNLTLEEYLGTN